MRCRLFDFAGLCRGNRARYKVLIYQENMHGLYTMSCCANRTELIALFSNEEASLKPGGIDTDMSSRTQIGLSIIVSLFLYPKQKFTFYYNSLFLL